jgi:DnaJ-class molecular chaperone
VQKEQVKDNEDALQRAYTRQALHVHPNWSQPGTKPDSQAFKEVNEAFYILKEDEMRKEYDSALSKDSGYNFTLSKEYQIFYKQQKASIGSMILLSTGFQEAAFA